MQQGRLHNNSELKPLIKTLKQREELLDGWRRGEAQTPKQRQAAWLLLDQIVVNNTTRHYKHRNRRGKLVMYGKREWHDIQVDSVRVQDDQDTHYDRCLILAELLRKRLDKSVGWCITAYRIRFPQFECKRVLEKDGFGSYYSEQSNGVKDMMKMNHLFRRFPRQSVSDYAIMLRVAWPGRYKYETTARRAAESYMRYLKLKQTRSLDTEQTDYLEGKAWHGTNCINPAPFDNLVGR